MHHQFRHPWPIVAACGQIQITEHLLAVSTEEMLGAVSRQLPQNLFTDGRHQIEISCRSDDVAYLLLLVAA